MARSVTTNRKIINTAAAWAIGLLIFFPIFWTILTSFKTEAQAISNPPVLFGFDWTLENYSTVMERSNYSRFLWNSIIQNNYWFGINTVIVKNSCSII